MPPAEGRWARVIWGFSRRIPEWAAERAALSASLSPRGLNFYGPGSDTGSMDPVAPSTTHCEPLPEPRTGERGVTGSRRLGTAELVTTVLFVLWSCYSLNGFRGWWVPITISDSDAGSGLRQALFLGSAAVGTLTLWITGRVWETVRTQWLLLLLGLWIALTATYSDLPSTTVKRAILFGSGCVTAATLAMVTRDPLVFIGRLLAIVTTAAASISIAWWALFPAAISTNPMRPGLAGISNHPNTLGPALALGVVLCLGAPWTGRLAPFIRFGSAATCLAGLLMTTSVTSISLGLFAAAVFGLLLVSSYSRVVLILGMVVALIGALIIGLENVGDSLLGSMGRDASMSGRSELWAIIYEEIGKAPVFGHGWGAFWTEGKGRELVATWNPRQSHNGYLDIVLDLGLVGATMFLGYVSVVGLMLVREMRDRPDHRVLCSGMLAGLISLFAVFAFQQSFFGKVDSFPFIVVLVIGTGVARARAKAAPRVAEALPAPENG